MSKRHMQVRLSGLFVLTACLCAYAAVWHYQRRALWRDQQNLKELEEFGVSAVFNSSGATQLHFEPGPNHVRLKNEQLPLLRKFRNVWALNLIQTDVTDAGLDELSQMPQLRFVLLPKERFTSEQVDEMKRRMPNLTVALQ